eukprot:scaffold25540_cov35-Tisochrysis_lutea.AAC.2
MSGHANVERGGHCANETLGPIRHDYLWSLSVLPGEQSKADDQLPLGNVENGRPCRPKHHPPRLELGGATFITR